MSTSGTSYKATVDGLGKKGNVFTFLVGLGPEFQNHLNPGDTVIVEDVSVTVGRFEDNLLYFERSLEQLLGTGLVEVEVGSEVTVRLMPADSNNNT